MRPCALPTQHLVLSAIPACHGIDSSLSLKCNRITIMAVQDSVHTSKQERGRRFAVIQPFKRLIFSYINFDGNFASDWLLPTNSINNGAGTGIVPALERLRNALVEDEAGLQGCGFGQPGRVMAAAGLPCASCSRCALNIAIPTVVPEIGNVKTEPTKIRGKSFSHEL